MLSTLTMSFQISTPLNTLWFLKPAKTVKTHGEWVLAWDSFIKATLFVFKHRQLKLQRYGKHIQRLFMLCPIQYHAQVINYDWAAYIRAAQCWDVKLTDIMELLDLQLQWINYPSGPVSSMPSKSWTKTTSNCRQSTPCRRWNDSKCPNLAATCNYQHVCLKCFNANHTANNCSTNKK